MFMPSLPAWLWAAARIAAFSAGFGLAGLLLLPRFSAVVNRVIQYLPCKPAMRDKIELVAQQFLLGSGAFSNGRRVLRFLLYTTLIWSLDSAGAVVVARCLHLRLSFVAAVILIVALALASAVPSAPGALGISQFVAVTVLALFAFNRDDALVIILVWQCAIYVALTLWGTLALWKLRQLDHHLKTVPAPV
jgi:hypothetical protein